MDSTAIVAGASGLVGSQPLPILCEQFEYVFALVRRPLGFTHARLEERGLADCGFAGADAVFVTLGTTIKKAGSQEAFRAVDFDLPLEMARAASAAGVRQFLLVTSVDSDSQSRNFYLRVKGELEREIHALPFAGVHVFRPRFLVGDRPESRLGERIGIGFAQVLSRVLAASLRKYRPISASKVAAAAREAKPGRHLYHFDDMVRYHFLSTSILAKSIGSQIGAQHS